VSDGGTRENSSVSYYTRVNWRLLYFKKVRTSQMLKKGSIYKNISRCSWYNVINLCHLLEYNQSYNCTEWYKLITLKVNVKNYCEFNT